MTGFFRNGCCDTGSGDAGSHSVCVVVTDGFPKFSKAQGNDLSTPMPEFGFPGPKSGDRCCLCAHAGRKHLKRAKHLALSCVLLTKCFEVSLRTQTPRGHLRNLGLSNS
jgi:uncharacterized protein (DUF2237 family)